ncbi:hypothetical protein R1flu_025705 [Riccia fluitans]|uniref:Uncharacterized protein n=1 Tax=Riccia fluitans TaxID=41844 RepID=A0ABD1XZF6_9MARC
MSQFEYCYITLAHDSCAHWSAVAYFELSFSATDVSERIRRVREAYASEYTLMSSSRNSSLVFFDCPNVRTLSDTQSVEFSGFGEIPLTGILLSRGSII